VECPKCGHRIPEKDDKCLYCGAWTKGEVTYAEKPVNNLSEIRVTKKEISYKKLQDLPEPLRAKVEEMLRKGESQNVEIETPFCNFPESMARTSRKEKKKMSFLAALKILLKKD
jgi:hypothetical protein